MQVINRVLDMLAAGGFYMYPIFMVSVLMFALIIHCAYTGWGLSRSLRRLKVRYDATALHGSLAGLLVEYCESRCPKPELNIRLGEELGHNFVSRLGTEGKSIMLCASIAMLLGLLGTVSGMINCFESIQLFGVGNTKSFASGISEALLTTQSGLMVGVVGVVAGQTIKRLHARLKLEIFRYIERIEGNSEMQCGACYVA